MRTTMMKPLRPRWLLVRLGLLLPIAAACGHFDAVEATGKMGSTVADRANALRSSAALCEETKSLTGAAPDAAPNCVEVDAQSKRWTEIAKAVGAYGSKLATFAKREEPEVESQLKDAMNAGTEASWSSLTTDQNAAVAKFAKVVVDLLSKSYRSGIIDDTVSGVDRDLQVVITSVAGEVTLRLAEVRGLQVTAGRTTELLRQAPAGAITPPVPGAWGPGLVLLRHDLHARAEAYTNLLEALKAFGAAHAKLKENLGKLDTKEAFSAVLEVVKSSYKAVEALRPANAEKKDAQP